ncbi:MAG TPA: dienelactone hydrolase family protein [Azospirillaceae bacterium]|nr:dienelactone hydrolase family protein [Azospirillaceae bacterium]
MDMTVRRIEVGTASGADPWRPVRFDTDRGPIDAHWYPAETDPAASACGGIVWVGGVGDGLDTPARGLYPRLAADLATRGVHSLRIRFRTPTHLPEAVRDTVAGLRFLSERAGPALGVVGHSMGGAVAIQAAAAEPGVVAAATLATQGYGAGQADRLGPRCALLLIHGMEDDILPPSCSQYVHGLARDPKRLVLLPGAGHALDEAAEVVEREILDFLLARLDGTGPRVE